MNESRRKLPFDLSHVELLFQPLLSAIECRMVTIAISVICWVFCFHSGQSEFRVVRKWWWMHNDMVCRAAVNAALWSGAADTFELSLNRCTGPFWSMTFLQWKKRERIDEPTKQQWIGALVEAKTCANAIFSNIDLHVFFPFSRLIQSNQWIYGVICFDRIW